MIERPTPTGDPTLARAIARWLRAVDTAALDVRVTEKAKLCLLDMIGVAAEAADLPWTGRPPGTPRRWVATGRR